MTDTITTAISVNMILADRFTSLRCCQNDFINSPAEYTRL